jgi:predicted RNA-binding Zn ribbon-like protein
VFQKEGDPVALAVYVINTWDELEDPPELVRDVETLRGFLRRRGLDDVVGGRELTAFRALRGRLRAAFDAEDEETAVARLNDVLRDSAAKRRLERDGRGWRFRYVGRTMDVLAATSASSLLEAISEDGWERFGVCAGSPCCCVFVDRSKNRSRRFCSDLCADRIAQATYRDRRRSRR